MGVKILGAAMLVLLANVGQGSQVYAKTILPRPAVQRPATAESGTAKQAISLGLHVANERLAEPLTHTLGYAQSSCKKGGDGIVCEPLNEQVDRPIAGFEQASESPFGNLPWAPAGPLVQGFAAGRDGLHRDEPAENQSVLALP